MVPQRLIESIEELKSLAGTRLGVSEWVTVDQQRISMFAEATDDRYWIHTDPDRAARETPYGGTIAHGLLTLSLLPHFVDEIFELGPRKLSLNYGLDRVRFTAPVPVGSRLRGVIDVNRVQDDGTDKDGNGILRLFATLTVEIEGQDRPACIAEFIILYYV